MRQIQTCHCSFQLELIIYLLIKLSACHQAHGITTCSCCSSILLIKLKMGERKVRVKSQTGL